LLRALREEQLVLSASDTFSSAQNLFHGFLSKFEKSLAATKKAAGGASAASEGFGSYEDFTRREAA
jgi:hypothetical protein